MSTSTTPIIGIIGGSGLEKQNIVSDVESEEVDTEFGKPSSALKKGKVGDTPVVIISRHGEDHSIQPSEVNYRANVQALKDAGCTHIIVATACGSLQEEMQPGQFVILDQFIDRTTKRDSTFYDSEHGNGAVCHIPMGEPFCPKLRQVLIDTCEETGVAHHTKGNSIQYDR